MRLQLIHPNVQKCSSTTRPRSSPSRSAAPSSVFSAGSSGAVLPTGGVLVPYAHACSSDRNRKATNDIASAPSRIAVRLVTIFHDTPLTADWFRITLPRMAAEQKFRTCNLCEAMCGLVMTVDGGRITDVRADRD